MTKPIANCSKDTGDGYDCALPVGHEDGCTSQCPECYERNEAGLGGCDRHAALFAESLGIVRRWTAVLAAPGIADIPVPNSRFDTLDEQVRTALRFALQAPANDVEIVIYKTTKARGTERDRSFRVEGRRAVYQGA